MCVKMGAQGDTMEPQGHPKCQRDTTRPRKVHWVKPQGTKKHIQTARGRVLAAGDVDPAAGSRDEPTRLHVEVPIKGLRYKYTRALFLKSINWVPPLPPTFAGSTFLSPGVTPKHIKKTLKKPRAPMEAQRLKTRGPNPNPSAQAESQRCLPLSTNTRNNNEVSIF